MNEEELLKQFEASAIKRGNETYLAAKEGLKFVAACEANNLLIFDVEAYRFKHGWFITGPDLMADEFNSIQADWEKARVTCNQAAKNLIETRILTKHYIPQLYLNFTVLNTEEYSNYLF